MAIVIVVALLTLGLGWREALIVAVAVPVVFGLTLAVNLLLGLHDQPGDAVCLDPVAGTAGGRSDCGRGEHRPPLRAPQEGNSADRAGGGGRNRPPLITATLAVIVSFLPMFFITGMMGPYMRPMALNVPVTMLMSMVVAFTITPWLAYHVLKRQVRARGGTADHAAITTRTTWRPSSSPGSTRFSTR